MTKTLTAVAAAAALTLGTLAPTTEAEARRHGGAIAAGVIGGLALGAMMGGAMARPYYYAPGAYYGGYGYGYGPAPVYYGPRCFWQRQTVWDGFTWRPARVRVCY